MIYLSLELARFLLGVPDTPHLWTTDADANALTIETALEYVGGIASWRFSQPEALGGRVPNERLLFVRRTLELRDAACCKSDFLTHVLLPVPHPLDVTTDVSTFTQY